MYFIYNIFVGNRSEGPQFTDYEILLKFVAVIGKLSEDGLKYVQ